MALPAGAGTLQECRSPAPAAGQLATLIVLTGAWTEGGTRRHPAPGGRLRSVRTGVLGQSGHAARSLPATSRPTVRYRRRASTQLWKQSLHGPPPSTFVCSRHLSEQLPRGLCDGEQARPGKPRCRASPLRRTRGGAGICPQAVGLGHLRSWSQTALDLDLRSAKYTLSTLGNYLTSLGHTAL